MYVEGEAEGGLCQLMAGGATWKWGVILPAKGSPPNLRADRSSQIGPVFHQRLGGAFQFRKAPDQLRE